MQPQNHRESMNDNQLCYWLRLAITSTLRKAWFYCMKIMNTLRHVGGIAPATPKPSSDVVPLNKRRTRKLVENLYTEHKASLCSWLQKRYRKHPADAEEIAHKAFTKMLELESLDHVENPKAFLYTVAVNFALHEVRHHATRQKYIDQEVQNISHNVEEMTPERIYNSGARLQRLISGMDKLSDKQKTILQMSRIEGQTYEQIQQQTGWSLADISRQLTRAMALMRAELAAASMQQDDQ